MPKESESENHQPSKAPIGPKRATSRIPTASLPQDGSLSPQFNDPHDYDALQLPLTCIIEVYTDGERRAHALAQLLELKMGVFQLSPFSLREICGPEIEWQVPPRGEPIDGLTSFDGAHAQLLCWAERTIAFCARLHR